jgi:hypothetical protein
MVSERASAVLSERGRASERERVQNLEFEFEGMLRLCLEIGVWVCLSSPCAPTEQLSFWGSAVERRWHGTHTTVTARFCPTANSVRDFQATVLKPFSSCSRSTAEIEGVLSVCLGVRVWFAWTFRRLGLPLWASLCVH